MMAKNSYTYSQILSDYRLYLKLERNMSGNSISGYISDCTKLFDYLTENNTTEAESITPDHLNSFLLSVQKDGISKRSQARLISALRSLFKFMEAEKIISGNPEECLDAPKINRYLPAVLSVEEVTSIIESIDLSKADGHRNRAILETLYSCGLRVSEVISLRISDLFFNDQFIRIIGKGNKQRLVPIGEPAIKQIRFYIEDRKHITPKKGSEDILFLNRLGGKLSRVAVFNLVKECAAAVGITKVISPHTFRHSFATHLIENGADIRIVQEMLGHESVLTTEIYTHIDSKKQQENILNHHPIQ